MRMAGRALMIGAAGAGGAGIADALAHDDMDRAAQGYLDLASSMQGSDEMTQRIYAGVFSQGEMSIKDRILAAGILSGELPPGAADEAKRMADSPAGKKGIDLAAQVMMNQPQLGPPAAKLAEQEIALFAKEAQMGVGPQDVVLAADHGAGVSPLPAILGGAGVGTGAAIVDALVSRMSKGSEAGAALVNRMRGGKVG